MLEDEADDEPSHGEPIVAERLYGHFTVERGLGGEPVELGRGAMGTTYKALDTILHLPVALKVISRNVAALPAARARFLREARIAARLHHPNVAGVTFYGEQAGECFYVMELVVGETLEQRVSRDGPLPPELALEIVAQVTHALAAAEGAGIVHRDLKPSNLMLAFHPGEADGVACPLVKVIDFGLGKVVSAMSLEDGGLVDTHGGFVGTPAFASPEQFALRTGARIDGRADIYSLGATLWYLLCARVPFAGRTLEEITEQRSRQSLAWDQLTARRVPAVLLTLLKHMLSVDPAHRPQSARELLGLIGTCQQQLLPPAGSSRRRRVWLVAAILGVIAVAGALVVGFHWHSSKPLVATQDRSIAVLPFENLSADKDNAFFANGVQDEILTDLAKVADLKVVSRTSVLQYKDVVGRNLPEIGHQLGVAYLLEGSVQRAGNQVRVNAQLVDTRTDTQRWAEHYDRPLDDVFAIQSEIARAITSQLQVKLSAGERQAIARAPTTDISAFDLYSQAKTILLTAGADSHVELQFHQAIDLLNQALARDPAFLQAACELAGAHGYLYGVGYDHTPQRLTLAETALQTALRLGPEVGESHLARAFHLYRCYHDYDGALTELGTVRRLLPNNARVRELTGYIQRRQGKWETSLHSFEAARELDPRDFYLLQQIALCEDRLRRYQKASEMYSLALAVRPDDASTAAARAVLEIDWKADPQPLHQVIDSMRANNPSALLDVADQWLIGSLAERDVPGAERALAALGDGFFGYDAVHLSRTFGEGVIGRMTGDLIKAREAFTQARAAQAGVVQAQPDYGPPLAALALIDAGLGRKEDALREARRAVELTPVSKDAINGSLVIEYQAMTAAWVGDKDLACEQLALAARLPGPVSYGKLKLLPYWDPLRGDPRFEAIVASLAPKK